MKLNVQIVTCKEALHLKWLTFQQGAYFSQGMHRAKACVLSNSKLHEQKRDAAQEQHGKVGNEKGTWNRWIEIAKALY